MIELCSGDFKPPKTLKISKSYNNHMFPGIASARPGFLLWKK